MELLWRFLIGGLLTSFFALSGDVLRPKSFAGLFGAAPSIALATLTLTVMNSGAQFASLEARSMIAGAAAFIIYALVMSRTLMHRAWPVMPVAMGGLLLWLAIASIVGVLAAQVAP